MTDKGWLDCVKLSKIAGFEELLGALSEHSLLWRAWAISDSPEEGDYPPPYGRETSLSPFHKLMLLRLVSNSTITCSMISLCVLGSCPFIVYTTHFC